MTHHSPPLSTPHGHHAGEAIEPVRGRWTALVLLSVAQFMLILDVTVVNVALPSMGVSLGLSREAATWVVTSYTLCFGGLMLLGGRLADTFGARRMVLIGIAVFTLASLTSGLAGSGSALIAGRVAQGVGAAMLSPAALSSVTSTFHGAERNRALGVWAALGGIGSAAGVLLGGALTSGAGWRWVFFVNVPVGVAVLIALPLVVAAAPAPAVRQRIDLPGAALVTGGTAALIYGLVKAGDAGWAGAPTIVSLAVAVLLYAGFVVVERSVRTPLMDLRMLTRRPVFAGALMFLIATALLIGFFFLGSFYLQHVRGYSAFKTGLMFLPVAVGTALGAHLGGHLASARGGRGVSVVGLLCAAIGAGLLTGIGRTGSPFLTLLPGFVIASVGIGAVFVAAMTTALGFVEPQESGLASGVVNTFHEVGGSIGVAVLSTIAAAGIQHGTISGFDTAFMAAGVAAIVAAVFAFAVVPGGRPLHAPQGAMH